MEKARMQSSPRPTCGRRIVAGKRPRPDDSKNCVRKLLKREISRAGNWAFNRTNSQEKFRNFHLQVGVGWAGRGGDVWFRVGPGRLAVV